jgi:hypothetical protein
LYATIKNADAATPVADIANVMAEESRLSLCTMAIAISAQAATTGPPTWSNGPAIY